MKIENLQYKCTGMGFAEEALNIMKDNRRKTLETKEIMSGILEVSNKLI
jgi:hypothetical protein